MGLLADIIKVVGVVEGNFDDLSMWQTGWLSDAADTGSVAFSNRRVTVTEVSLTPTLLTVWAVDSTGTYVLSCDDKGAASLDGSAVPHAAMVFQPKPSFAHPLRLAFDFRPIPLVGGGEGRFNLRFDPS